MSLFCLRNNVPSSNNIKIESYPLMINVVLRGGLGNNLFQYAIGRHLALKNNTTVRFDIQAYVNRKDILGGRIIRQLRFFSIDPISYTRNIRKKIGRRLGILRSSFGDGVYHEKDWGFDPEVLSLDDGVCLDGCFQSEKYFKDIEEVIRSDLRFTKDSFGEEGVFYKEKILASNSVGIHVRRGDYMTSQLHNVCTMEYYARSIAYIKGLVALPHFFVFSDDVEWCSENLNISDCTFVKVTASGSNPLIDLQLMSLCKHNIISNSTYSWWAAWLNENHEKIVVAPNRWFNDESMNARALQDTIPDDWVHVDF